MMFRISRKVAERPMLENVRGFTPPSERRDTADRNDPISRLNLFVQANNFHLGGIKYPLFTKIKVGKLQCKTKCFKHPELIVEGTVSIKFDPKGESWQQVRNTTKREKKAKNHVAALVLRKVRAQWDNRYNSNPGFAFSYTNQRSRDEVERLVVAVAPEARQRGEGEAAGNSAETEPSGEAAGNSAENEPSASAGGGAPNLPGILATAAELSGENAPSVRNEGIGLPTHDRAEEASLVLQASEEQSEPAPSFVGGKKEAQDYLSFPLTSQAALEASQAELRESQAALEASQAELRVSQAALQASQAELRVSQAALQASRAALQESKEGARAEIAALRIFISGETKSMKEAILEGVRVEREATMQEARNVKRSREESDQIRQIVLQCEDQKRTIERLESDLRAAELEKVPVHNLDSGEQETMNIKKRKLDRDEGSASALYDIVKVKSELVHDQQDEMKYRDLFIDKQQSELDQLEERLSEARNAGEQDAQTIKGLVENIEALTEENKKQMRQSRQAQTKKKR